MPSFDIVSKVDLQEVDNAINNSKKELLTRFDFRGSKTEINLDRKNLNLTVITENEMRAKAVKELLSGHLVRRKVDPRSLNFEEPYASGTTVRIQAKIVEGVEMEKAKKIVKKIKDLNLKVQASIQDNQVRVQGKKIDDLQNVITALKDYDIDIPLQYVNMKS